MTAFTDWLPDVLPWMPGCPADMAAHAIKRSAINFCERSGAYQSALPAMNSVANQGAYVLADVAAGVRVARVLEVRWQGTKLVFQRPGQLKSRYDPADWRNGAVTTAAAPVYWTQEAANSVNLVPAPNAIVVGAIGLWVACRPKDDATALDDAIASDYRDAITDGAKTILASSPGKPYTNLPLAAECGARFEQAIKNAVVRAWRGARGRARMETQA